MHFVLAVPPATSLDLASQALARLTGGQAIDHRQTLLKNVPLIPVWADALPEAQTAATLLNQAGLEAWVLHERALDAVPEAVTARAVRLEPETLVVSTRTETLRVPLAEVLLILKARVDREVQTATETTTKASKVMLLAGVPGRTKVTTERNVEGERDAFLLVFTATQAVRLPRDGLDYTGLGPAMQASAQANYMRLVQWLTAACPNATVDGRLEKVAGRLPVMPADARQQVQAQDGRTTVKQASLAYDNEGAVLRAARLLYLAARRRRLPV